MSEKLNISLVSWIKEGLLGRVSVGCEKALVSQLLSPPRGWASTETPDEIDDFMDADIWGYGIWTLYFDGNVLDAVTCSVEQVSEHGWFFNIDDVDQDLFGDVLKVVEFLKRIDVPYKYIDGGVYILNNVETGELITRRKRLAAKTILAGVDLKTRILFDMESEHVKVMAYPFSAEGQVISHRRCLLSKGYVLA